MSRSARRKQTQIAIVAGVSAVIPAFLVDAGLLLSWVREGELAEFSYGIFWLLTAVLWVITSVQIGSKRRSVPGNLLTTLAVGTVPLLASYFWLITAGRSYIGAALIPLLAIVTLFCTLASWTLLRFSRAAVVFLAYVGLALMSIATTLTVLAELLN